MNIKVSELRVISSFSDIFNMSAKHPPSFNPDMGDKYEHWKKDIEVWRLLADDKVKKGPAVYLSLAGEASTSSEASRSGS